MSPARVLAPLIIIALAGCASEPPAAPEKPPEAKLIAASEAEPLKPDDALLDATSAGDRILGTFVHYAKVRELDVEPLRATLERFRKDLVQHLRRETITSVWIDVPGKDGLAHERYQIDILYRRGLATYAIRDGGVDDLKALPKLPSDERAAEVWYRAKEPDKAWRPARQLDPAARRIKLGRVFDSGKISGEATAWVRGELVEN